MACSDKVQVSASGNPTGRFASVSTLFILQDSGNGRKNPNRRNWIWAIPLRHFTVGFGVGLSALVPLRLAPPRDSDNRFDPYRRAWPSLIFARLGGGIFKPHSLAYPHSALHKAVRLSHLPQMRDSFVYLKLRPSPQKLAFQLHWK